MTNNIINENNEITTTKPLVNCTKCYKKIEYGTKVCPHCNGKQTTTKKILGVSAVVIGGIILLPGIVNSNNEENKNKDNELLVETTSTETITEETITTTETTTTTTTTIEITTTEGTTLTFTTTTPNIVTETEVNVVDDEVIRDVEVPEDEPDWVEDEPEYFEDTAEVFEEEPEVVNEEPEPVQTNILTFYKSTESHIIHIDAGCGAVQNILPENFETITINEDELDNYNGTYQACKRCSGRFSKQLPTIN